MTPWGSPNSAAIAALVRSAAASSGLLTERQLGRIAFELASAEDLWRPLVRHVPEHRWYVRLFHDRQFDVWLLGWDVAQDTSLHDHGGSSGAFCVTEGALAEHVADLGAPPRLGRHMHLPGAPYTFGAPYIHNLGNEGPGVASSIHAYSPPLSSMTYYKAEPRAFEPIVTIPVEGPEPSVPAAAASA